MRGIRWCYKKEVVCKLGLTDRECFLKTELREQAEETVLLQLSARHTPHTRFRRKAVERGRSLPQQQLTLVRMGKLLHFHRAPFPSHFEMIKQHRLWKKQVAECDLEPVIWGWRFSLGFLPIKWVK